MQRKTRLALVGGGLLIALVAATVGVAMAKGPMTNSLAEENGIVTGTFVTFGIDPSGRVTAFDLVDENSTHPLVESIAVSFAPEGDVTAAAGGRGRGWGGYLVTDGAGNALALSDSPRAGFRVGSVNGTTVTLTLPAGATIGEREEVAYWSPPGASLFRRTSERDVSDERERNVAAVIDYGTEKARLVLSHGADLTVDGSVLTITLAPGSHAAFRLVVGSDGEEIRGGPGGHGPGLDGPGHGGPGMRGPSGHGPRHR